MEPIVGDDQNNTLTGGDGDDTLIGGAGDDELRGGGGIDTAVFEGDFEDFEFNEIFSLNQTNILEVTNGSETDTLFDVEFLSFDNKVVSVLDFIDDFADTRDGFDGAKNFITPGDIELNQINVPQDAKVFALFDQRSVGAKNGTIDASGDIDAFSVFLEAGKTYQIDAEWIISPEVVIGLEILNVFDPNDVLLDEVTNTGPDNVTFTATEDGFHLFTLGGLGDSTGNYAVTVDELRLIGDSLNNDLKGTTGDDVLAGNGGSDFIDGNGGIDVAVFDGNREDFRIGTSSIVLERAESLPFGSSAQDTRSLFVSQFVPILTPAADVEVAQAVQARLAESELINVEFLRFDDGDVSVLEFIDDFNDTLGTSGDLKFGAFADAKFSGKSKFGPIEQITKGSIDTINDVDTFKIDLDAGETFALAVAEFGLVMLAPSLGNEESTQPFTVQSIIDPEGNTVEQVNDDVTAFFKANQAGSYLISVTGVGENIGNYFATVTSVPLIGDDTANTLFTTPLDDVIDAKGGDDTIFSEIAGGNDTIDGGAGDDTIEIEANLGDLKFSVSDETGVTVTDTDGNVSTIINVENFLILGAENQTFTLADLQAFAELAGEDETFTLQFGNDDDNILTGGRDNDIFVGGAGNDLITDAGGDNNVNGGEGEDIISLVSGTNTVDGGTDSDLIIGGFGNDDLAGGTGDDVIIGDVSTNLFGSDRIEGGAGDDLLEGRGGQDTFVFNTNDGTDTIGTLDINFDEPADTRVTGADFVSGLDLIALNGFAYADQDAAFANVTDVDGVATFADQGTTIIFDGRTTADLSSDDFILV